MAAFHHQWPLAAATDGERQGIGWPQIPERRLQYF
jgi:hypothetical protein